MYVNNSRNISYIYISIVCYGDVNEFLKAMMKDRIFSR
jgi:hypothetical protein